MGLLLLLFSFSFLFFLFLLLFLAPFFPSLVGRRLFFLLLLLHFSVISSSGAVISLFFLVPLYRRSHRLRLDLMRLLKKCLHGLFLSLSFLTELPICAISGPMRVMLHSCLVFLGVLR